MILKKSYLSPRGTACTIFVKFETSRVAWVVYLVDWTLEEFMEVIAVPPGNDPFHLIKLAASIDRSLERQGYESVDQWIPEE